MRVPIRVQLALLVLLMSMIALAVVSISTWINNYNFVVDIKSQGLALTASLKAAQIASDLQLLESTCSTIVTRILIQSAMSRFYKGNNTMANWVRPREDIEVALSSGGYSQLLQVRVYSKNETGDINGLLNVTAEAARYVQLPFAYPNGSVVYLGDTEMVGNQNISTGMPPSLYPNITHKLLDGPPTDTNASRNTVPTTLDGEFTFGLDSVLLLGPLMINTTFSVVSITLPIINNTSNSDILGYMTILAEASALYNVQRSREGLDDTGVVLLLRPAGAGNRFPKSVAPSTPGLAGNRSTLGNSQVRFLFPPSEMDGVEYRHPSHRGIKYRVPFDLKNYPAALDAFSRTNRKINNASSELDTRNEDGFNVAVGYARPQSRLADWLLIVEQTKDEAFGPVATLRKILLACVFGTAGFILLLIIPMAYYSVLPITRLKEATEKSVQPPGYTPSGSIRSVTLDDDDGSASGDEENGGRTASNRSKQKKGFMVKLRRLGRPKRRRSKAEHEEDARRRVFKIPGKVEDRKHWISDELTELTGTFNEMSDELMMQYSRLEERVAERTRELEISKKAAEAANESKTLFIANISHELKTPLNGILGMCAVCMGEDDLPRIKRSLQVVYKSGDLLLHLLNDLLTFSKNQIGQTISIDQKEFGLSDIKSQVVTIFDKQIKESKIDFSVNFIGIDQEALEDEMTQFGGEKKKLPALGPNGTRLKDMRLYGDQHRILQVLINLVSNSLKFTPEGGRVQVRIRCLGEEENSSNGSRKDSNASRTGSTQRNSRNRHRMGSGSEHSVNSKHQSRDGNRSRDGSKTMGTALVINPMDPKSAMSHVQVRERSPTPPPTNAKTLMFEFEVQDSGPGIPDNFKSSVFEPFFQGELGLNKKYGGTGLGLSICSQLATLMGGKIELESKVGEGTTFKMTIPLKFVRERVSSTASSSVMGSHHGSRTSSVTSRDDAGMRSSGRRSFEVPRCSGHSAAASNVAPFEQDLQPRLIGLSQPFFANATVPDVVGLAGKEKQLEVLDRVAANKGSGKIRVLVAEDNLVNQEVVLRMLKLEDIYDVTVAKDGQEAYEIVKSSMASGAVFNLIFMDIQMPNLDGLQSTRLIRQMGYSAPIVALTAFAEESNVKECMESGMDMFLSKPIRRPALKQVLRRFATIEEEEEKEESPKSSKVKINGINEVDGAMAGGTEDPLKEDPLRKEVIDLRPGRKRRDSVSVGEGVSPLTMPTARPQLDGGKQSDESVKQVGRVKKENDPSEASGELR